MDDLQHRLGQLYRRIFELFRHMGARIWADETPNRRRQADEAG